MARKKTIPAETPPQAIDFDDAQKAKVLADNADQLAEFAATALVTAESLRNRTMPLEHFWLAPDQRQVLLAAPKLSKTIKAKLNRKKASFTIAEVASMTTSLVEHLLDCEPRRRIAILLVANHLMGRLRAGFADPVAPPSEKSIKPRTKSDPTAVYQFKITLLGSEPSIWRRIQVANCTLDKLHEHIQTCMGWTNSHLHRFEIGDKRYADPMLMEEDMDEFGYLDSTRTKISQVVPKSGGRLGFSYEYDFGDGWKHEVLFEGCPRKAAGTKYPVCLEGDRACPPEDVGGVGGFYEFLEALADPKHEEHDDFLEWIGGWFDPEDFDAATATKAMKQGLPEWRE